MLWKLTVLIPGLCDISHGLLQPTKEPKGAFKAEKRVPPDSFSKEVAIQMPPMTTRYTTQL